ncbi:hypothetical protein KA036_00815 [Candidatus Gracilibacteria bacterium]|jgi:hypothetical protein|nr:hypothetical protein [Candidatus Gracilibacteria bacterium]
MNTQVSFTTDLELKKIALEKAKQQGITLKALLVYAMKDFVDGKISLGLKTTNPEQEIQELFFEDKELTNNSQKLAKLLSNANSK